MSFLLMHLLGNASVCPMVRTKHTAKKSNGDSVPCIILNFARATSTSGVECQCRQALTTSKATTVGGGDVEKRNACHKALSSTKATLPMAGGHNELPPDLETTVLQEDISFRWINLAPLWFSSHQRSSCLGQVLAHQCSPMEFVHMFLKSYYTGSGLAYLDVVYDIGTDEKLAPYCDQVRKMIRDTKEYHSTGVNDFLEIILQPWQGIIDRTQEPYLWMLCCGSLVNNKDSFHGLQEAVVCHKFTSIITFSAPCFQLSFTLHLLLSFTERILIGHCLLRLAFKDMVTQACDLGYHSDIFLLTTDKEGALTCSRFAWANLEVHSWGNHLPIQCSGCGWANSWRSAYVKGSKDKSYIFECKNDSCNSPGSTVLYSGRKNGSTWLDIPLVTEFA
ncbi:hypothetical protein BDR05DRAFT_949042 [Suillus weaverae]|nr:hypothetical protein BDR05DRAFT_949042 [Suillus weaverae]